MSHLEPYILERDAADVSRVEAICGNRAKLKVFSEHLRNVASRGLLGGPASAKGEVNIVEGDVFNYRIIQCV